MTEDSAYVLAVDDDPLTCRLIQFLLTSQGYEVGIANDPVVALRQIDQRLPDLVLLDLQLPKMDGFTLMRQLKRDYQDVSVIMLTARAEMQDRLAGLEAGADDYVVKPFEPAELLARVKAVLRRAKRQLSANLDSVVVENGLRLDVHNLTVTTSSGESVSLTPTETRILHRLMANANHVISREDLTAFAVGYGADTSNNQIDVYIGRIRRKIRDNLSHPRYIATVRGSGYKFLSPARLSGA
ncbi:MAG: response regulator transcription factor [Chloroflexota bacterium]|nr:response regulator transcription factor [Chloroflexota bacterium]